MNSPWSILHRTDVGIFDPLKNMAAISKIEHRGQTVVFRKYLQKPLDLVRF